ncbi:MAG: hypothetical protein A2W61_06500 [Deltaproteobacteria bacterium RIFCSPLOWO2_01_44_7]|nr:MAG: hypothetical protein A2712_03820 [Deltaproteobacteria bacterium RIFCSPHIGHO2_01_FULL_43_49]OGQ16315.1 MAG: hypothetical protein A3D22_01790 [Deltaproteobacteria bacterium RIFCSPHIGHO2_02_FULL_44_53]OGQ29275.1 MAG: hypothetical protein A3D98_05575 [Deltaproteobacteria bacterium RIFCSPHIGHO2_12_FULL_44_21]OGQ32832.1 MAG: hypothetical protein A2979_09720 [Deltaproteobacteria bacterium RIFCSPLOWO2_01_FULL_45_74]OGQ40675.1 MAG: hypothetical protein A2W61_06500 [Deltaproteobacteria bacterium 
MIGIVIPTYNERENLPLLVEKIFALKIPNVTLIIVDDNSPDGTGDIAEELAKKYGNIEVLHRKVFGRATAGLDGFKKALAKGAELIMEMDADLSHDPNDIPRFLEEIQTCDVVIGSRYGAGRIVYRSWFRNFLSDFANIYNRTLLGLKIRDVSGGFKCYRRKVLASLDLNRFISTGYTIGAETLYRISKKGFKIKEIPIIFRDRTYGASKCTFKVMLNYAYKIWQIRFF